ncbi:MotA/TolQ/ExbB proton channel family protein [Moraxella sp. VT-16-12]|uniref:MotA/TolQ/ExbB proton channel family protein n=1 Tax=Moraxella sp. VT-16-12 TaxID=2014877 RepID=UPI000B7D0D4F|nr:MotA/TolQ/ExbB proton channel family protein [Moraxella sp. VT-16-12]TWV83438.1 MotA/TolQ/ExbB proton channel family protein [Moraxella sp. VT-16-12]
MDFAHYWQYTDAVSKTLFFILIMLSVVSWIVGVARLLKSRQATTAIASDLSQKIASDTKGLDGLNFAQKKTITEQFLLKHIANYRFELEKGLPILGTTAAIAPFIGLFGTVWGIFHALHSIAKSGQAGLAQVAGPVGEALIMTGLGLAVAIPAVVFYNIITRMNRRAIHQANDTAHQLLANVVR